MTVDTKMIAKTLADRLTPKLHKLIGREQHAYVPGRLIQDGIGTIQHAIAHLEKKKERGAILAIDFSKAFDTVEHGYLWKTMQEFGIPEEYIDMVKTLYAGAESTVANGGETLGFTPLQRSCRQGDPLSPYLFILAIEPLLRKLRKNSRVSKLNGESCFFRDLRMT